MKRLFIFFILFYQKIFSPHKGIFRQFYLFPSPCLFLETCSDYALRQIKEKGWKKGLKSALIRLGNCHFFKKQKYD